MSRRGRSDEQELEDHFREHFPQVVASLTLVVGDRELARDAATDAFAKAYSRWSKVATYGSPVGWIYTVALNNARRAGRRRTRQRRLPPLASPPVHGDADSVGVGVGVWELLDTLPDRQRTAAVLRYGSDLTEADVAAAMGITRSTVSSLLRAAHARLAAQLAHTEADPTDRSSDARPR
jgi:RNA polymerase sigma-70 factor (ECF subfamily)